MLYNATRSYCVMNTNIYTLYSHRKCLVDKQTQEKRVWLCQASYSCPLTVHRSMMWTWELALWTAENQCLATARWAWCFFIYFFYMSSFTGSGQKFRTVLYTLHCPAEKAVRTSSEALWADEPLAWHVASPDLLLLERSLEMMVESMALPLNGDDYQFWKLLGWPLQVWITI